LGNVAKGTMVTVRRPNGRYQHGAVFEARPTANFREDGSRKNLVKGSTVKPVRPTIDAKRELVDVWGDLTNIRPSHREGTTFRGGECHGTQT